MQIKSFALLHTLLAVLITVLISACASKPPPEHPAYLLALGDLREARWNLERRPADAISAHQDAAILEVDHAITELEKAVQGDDKDLAKITHDDTRIGLRVRLHNAIQLMREAKTDITQEKDDAEAGERRNRILEHVEVALKSSKRAFDQAEARAAENHRLRDQK